MLYRRILERRVELYKTRMCRKEEATESTMRTMDIHKSLSHLHAECDMLIWTMECMKILLHISEVVFAID